MNGGIVAARYARAFYAYVSQRGVAGRSYEQCLTLLFQAASVPRFLEIITKSQTTSLEDKLDLVAAALPEEPLKEVTDFVRFVYTQGRISIFFRILRSFVMSYRQAHGILVGRLFTAVDMPSLTIELRDRFSELTGKKVEFETVVDASLIGGYIVELNDMRLDSSVRARLDKLSQALAM